MKIIIRVSSLILLLSLTVLAQSMSDEEIEYKADFIVKLISYVEWPAASATGENGAIVIGVVGNSPLIPKLKDLASKETAAGKTVTIKEISLADSFAGLQIVYNPTKDMGELAQFLKKVGTSPILTVGDGPDFARYGMMINFYKEEVEGKEKVKFEVNRLTAGDAGLTISSRLLKLAKII